MKQFVASRLVKNEINTIVSTLNEQNCTYNEKWYFNGKIYKEETRYCESSIEAKNEFDLAQKTLSSSCTIIHM